MFSDCDAKKNVCINVCTRIKITNQQIGAIIVAKTYNYNLNFLNYYATFALLVTLYYIDKGNDSLKPMKILSIQYNQRKYDIFFMILYKVKGLLKILNTYNENICNF